jgi:hypothetical protein
MDHLSRYFSEYAYKLTSTGLRSEEIDKRNQGPHTHARTHTRARIHKIEGASKRALRP